MEIRQHTLAGAPTPCYGIAVFFTQTRFSRAFIGS
jgi:hypothetical protein